MEPQGCQPGKQFRSQLRPWWFLRFLMFTAARFAPQFYEAAVSLWPTDRCEICGLNGYGIPSRGEVRG